MLLTQGDDLPKEARDALRMDLINESERLSRMLKNMLALSAYQAGRLHIERDPFLIQPVLRQVAREVEARHPNHRARVVADRGSAARGGGRGVDRRRWCATSRRMPPNIRRTAAQSRWPACGGRPADCRLRQRRGAGYPARAAGDDLPALPPGKHRHPGDGSRPLPLPAARRGARWPHRGREHTGAGSDLPLHHPPHQEDE